MMLETFFSVKYLLLIHKGNVVDALPEPQKAPCTVHHSFLCLSKTISAPTDAVSPGKWISVTRELPSP